MVQTELEDDDEDEYDIPDEIEDVIGEGLIYVNSVLWVAKFVNDSFWPKEFY